MSLRLRLLISIGTALTLLWLAVAFWMYRDISVKVQSVLDSRLQASARMVAGLTDHTARDGTTGPMQSAPPVVTPTRDGIACEVRLLRKSGDEVLLARTNGSPSLSGFSPGLGTYNIEGAYWRVFTLTHGNLRIVTAESEKVRRQLLRDSIVSGGVPFLVALIGSQIVLWLAIGECLKPLERIRLILADRKPADMSPVPEIKVPAELKPLVATVHSLLERVRDTIQRERQFTDDAAHELRTPLTAIKTNIQSAQLGMRTDCPSSVVQQSMANAEAGASRLQATLESLLLLARLDANEEDIAPDRSNIGSVLHEVALDFGRFRDAHRRIVIASERTQTDVPVPHHLLVCAIRNLLENALRYSPVDAQIDASWKIVDNQRMRLTVKDHGKGLTPEDQASATNRFWRRDRTVEGSGLGLSIVSAIATRFSGTLTLDSRPGEGLSARLEFPCSPSSPEPRQPPLNTALIH